MPTHRRNQTLLLLDASALETQTGLLRNGKWLAFHRSSGETLEALFQGVSSCLSGAGLDFKDVEGFLYCEGPGSVLGIRLAAMALKGWRSLPGLKMAPIYAYRSLPAMAHLMQLQERNGPPFHCICEGGKGLWNLYSNGEMKTVSSEEIENLEEPVYLIPLGRNKESPPQNAEIRPYHLEELPTILTSEALFRRTETPEVYRTGANVYAKWSGQRHR